MSPEKLVRKRSMACVWLRTL